MFAFLPDNAIPIDSPLTLPRFITPEGILFLVLNRPEVSNAFNGEQISHIIDALEAAETNPNVRVVILTGAGKHFCAGGDIQYMRRLGQNSFEDNKEDALQMAQLMFTLHELQKPTIARVNGAAFGGGVGLLCCCDMAFGSPKTKVCLSEVKIGMVAATIGPYIVKAIGTRQAHRYMLTAEILESEAARHAGFLSDVFPQESMDKEILQRAQAICNNGPQSVQTSKALLLNLAAQQVDENIMDYTAEIIASARASAEGKEGLSAFLEKRKPNFKASSEE